MKNITLCKQKKLKYLFCMLLCVLFAFFADTPYKRTGSLSSDYRKKDIYRYARDIFFPR